MSSRIRFIIKILVAALLFFGGYYFFILKPKLELPIAYIKAEKTIDKHISNLTQNRISLTAIKNFNPLSSRISLQKERAYESLELTLDSGLKLSEKPNPLSGLVKNDIRSNYLDLVTREKELFEKLKPIVERLKEINKALKQIFDYTPERDLDVSKLEDLSDRAENTVSGLKNLSEKLRNLKIEDFNKENVEGQINVTISAYQDLAKISREASGNTNSTKKFAIEEFNKLKIVTLNSQIDYLKSDSVATLIAEETNLINEFNYLLRKIDEVQKDLTI